MSLLSRSIGSLSSSSGKRTALCKVSTDILRFLLAKWVLKESISDSYKSLEANFSSFSGSLSSDKTLKSFLVFINLGGV